MPPHVWQQELYLVPTLPDDPVLQLDLEVDGPLLEEVTVKVNDTPSATSDTAINDDVALLKKRQVSGY